MILSLQTDSALAKLRLLSSLGVVKGEDNWEAGRSLADQILTHLENLIKKAECGWEDINGVVIYRGPGSFTSLRIGITVANTLASGLDVAIIGEENPKWEQKALARLKLGENDKIVLPLYDNGPHITKPTK